MLRYNWIVKPKEQQHNIELQMDTILGLFGTGGGRLLVDGVTVRHWGFNPFRLIPKGSCEFGIDGMKALVRSKFAVASPFSLVLGEQEIPGIEKRMRRQTKTK